MFSFFYSRKEVFLLLVIAGVFFYPPLFAGEMFFFRDLYLHFLPQKQLLVDIVLSGELPLWDPYIHGGQPLLADINNVVLYPSNILYFLFPVDQALSLDIVGHVALCGIGAYCLGRRLGLEKSASLISALIYSYNGFTLSLGNFLNRVLAAPYIPLVLLCWHAYLMEKRKKYFVFAALCSVLQVLAGAVETLVISTFFICCWSIVYPYNTPIISRLRSCLLLVLTTLMLSAIQVFPLAEMYSQSQRLPASQEITWSLNPIRLPELIFSHYFGRTNTLSQTDYWGRTVEDNRFPYILSIYLGLITLMLAGAGAVRNLSTNSVPRRVRLFLLISVLFFLALSLGRFLPFLQLLQGSIPILMWFRFPIKVLQGAILPVSLLAAIGAQDVLMTNRPGRRFITMCLFICFALLLFAVFFITSEGFSKSFETTMFGSTGENISTGLATSFLRTTILGLGACALLLFQRFRPNRKVIWVLTALLAIDLLTAGRSINPTADRRIFSSTPPAATITRQVLGSGRMYRVKGDSSPVLRAPENNVVWQYRWNLDALFAFSAAYYRIPVIFHEDYDRLANARIMRLSEVIDSSEWSRKIPMLSAGAVSVIVASRQFPHLPLVGRIENASESDLFVYRNPDPAPRVNFVTSGIFVESEEQSLAAIRSPSFNAKQFAVIEGASNAPSCLNAHASIREMKEQFLEQEYEVRTECSGYLVFSETNYPGWRVLVDGRPEKIYAANSAFSSIFLPEGTHTIHREYIPVSLIAGTVVSIASAALLLFVKI